MLIELKDGSGSPVYINPQYVVAIREDKHFGRPGVASDTEYRDTLILTTKGDFNVRDAVGDVAREINRVSREMLELKGVGGAGSDVTPPE